MHHRLHAGANRLKSAQPQQIECCSSQAGQRTSAITPVAVGVLVELGVTDPVPALNAPAVAHQSQQGLWGGAEAGVAPRGAPGELIQVLRLKRSPVSGADSGHLHNSAGANPALADVLQCLLCPQRPGDAATMADLLIRCHKWDRALSLELAGDLAMQRLLVALDRQEEVGPLLLEELKIGRWVWSASAWISTPSRLSSPRSFLTTARSWFSPVA